MINHLTYYYRKDTPPFQSLSALPDDEAIQIMRKLSDDTNFGTRFKNPEEYLSQRRVTEHWTREEFIAKGGKPQAEYPIPMVLGASPWMVKNSPDTNLHAEIHIPLSVFAETDVSFTYPDSMISYGLSLSKPPELYDPNLHGKVFLLSEILDIIGDKGLPERDWDSLLPENFAPYIEAQVWNHRLLDDYRNQ